MNETSNSGGGGFTPLMVFNAVGQILGTIGAIVRAGKYSPVAQPSFQTQYLLLEEEQQQTQDKIIGFITVVVAITMIIVIIKYLRK